MKANYYVHVARVVLSGCLKPVRTFLRGYSIPYEIVAIGEEDKRV
jgi:hypothetical protein